MHPIRATWINGQVVPAGPIDLPEGSPLIIEPVETSMKIGITESEWRDDPASSAEWEAWLKTIEPLEFTPEERMRKHS